DAEGGHRRRLEARMQELEIPLPNPDSVRIPLWLRLQTRIAPVDRLLAAREAAEDDEVDDLYKRSTGDPVTDTLLREIRKDDRRAFRSCRLGDVDGDRRISRGTLRGGGPGRERRARTAGDHRAP